MDDFFEPLRSTKYYSSKQEETVAKYLGWGVVSGSGSRAGKPGDISGAHFLGECKTHTQPNQQLLFDKDVWKKLQNEAQSTHRFPVLVVDDGSQKLIKLGVCFLYLLYRIMLKLYQILMIVKLNILDILLIT